MPINLGVQYTVRGVPREVDKILRRRAHQRGISLNQLLVEEICAAGGGQRRRYRSLKDLGGRWQEDPEFNRILAEQRRIDADLWK
jgi:hypothetical protein